MQPVTADAHSKNVGDQILAAASSDMEFTNPLPVLRHYLENLLAAFSHAICTRNTQYIDEMTGLVDVRLEGCPQCSNSSPTPGQLISWFGHGATPMRQTVTNLSIQYVGDSVLYSAQYQDWETAPQPRCMAIGTYHGRLKAGHQVWKWVEHSMSAMRCIPGCPHVVPETKPTASVDQGAIVSSNDSPPSVYDAFAR